jgi:DNA-binding IclR family transcriptional regulator
MCWVGAAVGDEIVILARVTPDSRLRGHPRIGQRFPFVAPVGAVFVAWAPLAEVNAWIDRAGATGLDDAEYYHRELRVIRERGFAVNLLAMAGSELAEMIEMEGAREAVSGDSVPSISQQVLTQLPAKGKEPAGGIANLIAPVFHADGRVLLSLTLEARVEDSNADLMASGRRLLEAAGAVTRSIHGAPPKGWPPAAGSA